MANARTMRAGELLLIDAATSFDHYSADVTRTLPVGGRFTPAQRAIYQIVLDAQAAFVRQIRPGAPGRGGRRLRAPGRRARLARLGLIDSVAATYDPPAGVRCPAAGCRQARLFALHGYGGHGIGPRGARPRAVLPGAGRLPPRRRVHRRARAVHRPLGLRWPPRHARQPRHDRPAAPGRRALRRGRACASRTTTPSPTRRRVAVGGRAARGGGVEAAMRAGARRRGVGRANACGGPAPDVRP
jgi:hypothetical protein